MDLRSTWKLLREKGIDLTHSYDKNPYTHRKNKKSNMTTQNTTKNIDYTTIADWLRTVSWSSNSHSTGVVKPGFKGTHLPPHRNSSVIKRKLHDMNSVYKTDFCQDGYILNVI